MGNVQRKEKKKHAQKKKELRGPSKRVNGGVETWVGKTKGERGRGRDCAKIHFQPARKKQESPPRTRENVGPAYVGGGGACFARETGPSKPRKGGTAKSGKKKKTAGLYPNWPSSGGKVGKAVTDEHEEKEGPRPRGVDVGKKKSPVAKKNRNESPVGGVSRSGPSLHLVVMKDKGGRKRKRKFAEIPIEKRGGRKKVGPYVSKRGGQRGKNLGTAIVKNLVVHLLPRKRCRPGNIYS